MGMMVDGQWTTKWYQPDGEGRFVREPTRFRRQVGDAEAGFPLEAGRYHLYVSHACPWAHRTLIVRKLRGLEDVIGVTSVAPEMTDEGWHFGDGVARPECPPDPHLGAQFLRELYATADPRYNGRVTVPVLWDTKRGTLVNNESRELIRMFDTAFEPLASGPSLAPEALRADIDAMISANYEPVNNGVYRAGFATTQGAYAEACGALFARLDRLEEILHERRFLLGDTLTEADICLFTTLVRFDRVYHGHFKCNVRRIQDYPNLWGYTRDVYQTPGVAETVDHEHIKTHYYGSHPSVNPHRIVPLGPEIDFDAPHGRG